MFVINFGDWEQRKLGDNSQILTGGTPKTQIKEYWEPKEIPWMSSGEINKKRLTDTDNKISKKGVESSSARWVKEKSVLIALAGQGKTRGTVAINEIPLTTNQSIAAIEPNKNIHSEFLYQNLDNRYDELRLRSSGDGSRGGLNKRIISDLLVNIPVIDEQIKIGNFFKQLDGTIALHQEKLEKLKQLKKGYLQVMFPQNGERTPRLKFAGFSSNWEQRKLGNVFEQTSNYINPKEENIELWSLTVENGLTPKTKRYNREFLVKKENQFKSVDNNEFIYNPMNMTLGAIDLNLTGKIVAVSGYYITMNTKNKYDSKYFSVWLKTPTAIKMYKLYATGSLIERQRIQFPTLAQIKTSIPSIKEQQEIGNFFYQLEQTITLHKKKF